MMRPRMMMERIAQCLRLDMTGAAAPPPGPVERIDNGSFSLLGTLWDILSGGWAITLGLATNLGVGLSAGMQQTFGTPFTSANATLKIDVGLNALQLSQLHAEIVCQVGTVVAYNNNPSAGMITVNNIVITSPATALRLYVTGVPGITIKSVSLIA